MGCLLGPGSAGGKETGINLPVSLRSWFHDPDHLLSKAELRRILARPRHQPFSVKMAGKPFQVVDSLSFYWGYREIFEQGIYRIPDLPASPRILDCGANLGLASLFFLRIYPECHLTALEPDPDIYGLLVANLESHKNPQTRLLNVALTAKAGTYDFHQHRGDSGRLGHPFEGSTAPTKVGGIPLDELLSEPVDFLKMDIEGGEVDVLAASRCLHLARFIFVEYHSFEGHPQELNVVLSRLSSAGFRYWLQNHFTPKNRWAFEETIEGMDAQINIFARRELR